MKTIHFKTDWYDKGNIMPAEKNVHVAIPFNKIYHPARVALKASTYKPIQSKIPRKTLDQRQYRS